MTEDERKQADAQLKQATTIGAILNTGHGKAILGNRKYRESMERQAKALGENLEETSDWHKANVKK